MAEAKKQKKLFALVDFKMILLPVYFFIFSLGKTKMESDIWMMHFGQKVAERVPPRLLFVGNVYGEEMTSREMLLQLIVHLCEQYKRDDFTQKASCNFQLMVK